jgi:hypothetical protein
MEPRGRIFSIRDALQQEKETFPAFCDPIKRKVRNLQHHVILAQEKEKFYSTTGCDHKAKRRRNI